MGYKSIVSGVYSIQSISNPSRVYVGSAVNIYKRWLHHLSELQKNKHHSGKLQNHYNKYGKNDLCFSILIGCDVSDLITTEQFFIDSYNPYFNIRKIANSNIGLKRTEESKQKMRKKRSIQGKINMSNGRKGIPAWNKGIKMSDNQKVNSGRKIGSIPWNKGKKGVSEITRDKMRESKRRYDELHKITLS